MKKLLCLVAALGSINAFADCHQFDGIYTKKCDVYRNRLGNEDLDGALNDQRHSLLIIKGSADCSTMTFNDPGYNGSFAPVYLTDGEFESGYTKIRQKGQSPTISDDAISVTYVKKQTDAAILVRGRTKVKLTMKKMGTDYIDLNYSAHGRFMLFFGTSYEASCVLTKLIASE